MKTKVIRTLDRFDFSFLFATVLAMSFFLPLYALLSMPMVQDAAYSTSVIVMAVVFGVGGFLLYQLKSKNVRPKTTKAKVYAAIVNTMLFAYMYHAVAVQLFYGTELEGIKELTLLILLLVPFFSYKRNWDTSIARGLFHGFWINWLVIAFMNDKPNGFFYDMFGIGVVGEMNMWFIFFMAAALKCMSYYKSNHTFSFEKLREEQRKKKEKETETKAKRPKPPFSFNKKEKNKNENEKRNFNRKKLNQVTTVVDNDPVNPFEKKEKDKDKN